MKYQMPEPVELNPLANSVMGYTYTQRQSAYEAGRLAGLEDAAKECMSWHSAWIDCQGRYEFMGEGAEHCADAIRKIAKETP